MILEILRHTGIVAAKFYFTPERLSFLSFKVLFASSHCNRIRIDAVTACYDAFCLGRHTPVLIHL